MAIPAKKELMEGKSSKIAGGQGESVTMVIEGEELKTVRDALELRKRTSGVGTDEHERCKRVLAKLGDAEARSQSSHNQHKPTVR
ncbi:MAG: hypothetical protein WBQ94_12190 [Terracidiphilus sp.]